MLRVPVAGGVASRCVRRKWHDAGAAWSAPDELRHALLRSGIGESAAGHAVVFTGHQDTFHEG